VTRPPLIARLSIVFACLGCHMTPQYPTAASWPHKDVLLVSVSVDTPLDARRYRDLARGEAARRLAFPSPSAVPVYEVRCEFVLRAADSVASRPLAIVRVFPSESDHRLTPTLAACRVETIVY